jgi:hypothetical protein
LNETEGWIASSLTRLERDDFSSNRHPALSLRLRMIFRKNRHPPRDRVKGHAFPDHALDYSGIKKSAGRCGNNSIVKLAMDPVARAKGKR